MYGYGHSGMLDFAIGLVVKTSTMYVWVVYGCDVPSGHVVSHHEEVLGA